ncbi:hypothetical protein [Natrinema sp. SYSU A 869]|uniref:hypothetical protein n=1 Tax=Natrinema sp. SYSU A 869 TaxID=2871694 RepID=UPI001CA3E974|nr:hypothetical protein [Natrinema sp. SYSU A 869]
MVERNAESTGVLRLIVAIALFAAVGGAAFWAWRRTAPLSRWYRQMQRRREERDQRGPNPQRNPGTDSI